MFITVLFPTRARIGVPVNSHTLSIDRSTHGLGFAVALVGRKANPCGIAFHLGLHIGLLGVGGLDGMVRDATICVGCSSGIERSW